MPYTKEQYESDKAIVENAPDFSAMHSDREDLYFTWNNHLTGIDYDPDRNEGLVVWNASFGEWDSFDYREILTHLIGLRSLQDIRDKIELYETVEGLKAQDFYCEVTYMEDVLFTCLSESDAKNYNDKFGGVYTVTKVGF